MNFHLSKYNKLKKSWSNQKQFGSVQIPKVITVAQLCGQFSSFETLVAGAIDDHCPGHWARVVSGQRSLFSITESNSRKVILTFSWVEAGCIILDFALFRFILILSTIEMSFSVGLHYKGPFDLPLVQRFGPLFQCQMFCIFTGVRSEQGHRTGVSRGKHILAPSGGRQRNHSAYQIWTLSLF